MGNREVPWIEILGTGADLGGARAKARPGKEGGSGGKTGFPPPTGGGGGGGGTLFPPPATEPKAEEAA
jgi:hypothetical protein